MKSAEMMALEAMRKSQSWFVVLEGRDGVLRVRSGGRPVSEVMLGMGRESVDVTAMANAAEVKRREFAREIEKVKAAKVRRSDELARASKH